MEERVLIGLTSVIALGVIAQWIAWRLRLPSILMLLLFGVAAGPLARYLFPDTFLDPDELFGALLLPLVSLSVAVILYEGGLSLSFRELPKVGGAVWGLVTIGMVVTWLLGAFTAWWLLELDWALSLLLGAVLVVSGPTVILPLLRHVRPAGRLGPITRWEGIVIDPLGAGLAVVVYEVAFVTGHGNGLSTAIWVVARTVIGGGFIGFVAGMLLGLLVRKHAIPDFLHNAVSLMLVTAAFTLANHLQAESGLFAVTAMGVVLANQRFANVRHIIDFKENLRVLLIAFLFILLAARLRFEDLSELGFGSFAFVAVLIVLVRPVAVVCSTFFTKLSLAEKAFLAWMAPRGIVAAAVASVFALKLEPTMAEARLLVPLTFLTIIGTVAIYGLTSAPLARLLGLADDNPQGLLLVGAHSWARALAETLQREGVQVVLIDRNRESVNTARMAGLRAYEGNVLGEHVLDDLDLRGIGRLMALTPNDEVNALAIQHFSREFERAGVYQLHPAPRRGHQKSVPSDLHGRELFAGGPTYAEINERYFVQNHCFRATNLTESYNFDTFQERYGDTMIPMFVVRKNGSVGVITARGDVRPRPGDTLIALGPRDEPTAPPTEARG